MGGLDDLLAGSADRWAKAERRAEGVADLCLGRAVGNYFTLYLPIGAVVLFPTGASLGMLSFPDEASITNIFGFGCLLTGVGLMIGGLVSNAKVLETAATWPPATLLCPSATTNGRLYAGRSSAGRPRPRTT